MNRPKFRTILTLIAFLISVATIGATSKEVEKNISREFDINDNGVVEIINKYGDIDIHTWDQRKVKINVRISVEARNEDKARETLDRINVEFSDSKARVKAITEISTIKNWKRWFGGKTDEFQVDFDVYLPATVETDLDNKYGDVFVPAMNNRVDVTLKYGNIQIEEINGDVNLSLGYAKGSLASAQDVVLNMSYSTLRCGDLEDVSIDSKYGRFEASSVRNLRSNSSYDDYKIDRAETVSNTGKYDDLILGTVGSLDIDTKYSDIVVSQLEREAELSLKYGGATLRNVQPGFSLIDVRSSYASVKIETAPTAKFVFEAYTKYCGVRDSGLEIYHDKRDANETTIKGFRGSRDASSRIVANMDYGSLSVN